MRRLRLFGRELWQSTRAAFFCRHRRLQVIQKSGLIFCYRCARVWMSKDQGSFAERWDVYPLGRKGVSEILRMLGKDRK